MFYPKEFYTSQKGSAVQYSTSPTSTIDIERVLRNDAACFISMQGKIEYKPRQLIFSDWTVCNWAAEKIKAFFLCMRDLRAQGFDIYFWCENELVLLTEKNEKSLCFPPIVHPEVIKEMAIKKNKQLSHDGLLVLDDYWINRLLKPSSRQVKRQIRLSDIVALGSDEADTLIPILKQLDPKVEEILVDEYSFAANGCLEGLKQFLPHCTLTPSVAEIKIVSRYPLHDYLTVQPFLEKTRSEMVKKVELNDAQALSELNRLVTSYPQMEELSLRDCSTLGEERLEGPEMNHLTRLLLHGCDISADNLLLLIQKTPKLEELDLYNCPKLEGDFFKGLCELKLPKLKRFSALGFRPQADNLMAFMKNNPSLELLKINGQLEIAGCIAKLPKDSQFPNLKEVHVSDTALTEADIKALLEKTPKLAELYISCKGIQGAFTNLSAHTNLRELKAIYASNSSLTATDLTGLLHHAPGLETLTLSSCSDILPGFSRLSSPTQLNSLKKIDLSKTGVDKDNLLALLKAAPNLESLELDSCKAIGGCFHDLSLPLRQLKRFSASQANLTAQDLHRFLTQAKNIETISLVLCSELSDEQSWVPSNNALSHLKAVYLSCSNVGRNNLAQLLEKTSNLEELGLNQCTDLDYKNYNLPASASLSKLKKFNASSSNISDDLVKAILERAPNLEELDLSSCYQLQTCFTQLPEKFKLTALKKFEISASSLTAGNINVFLKKSSNLETLRIYDLFNSQFIDALDPDLKLPKLTYINLSFAHLAPSRLAKMRAIAPNLQCWHDLNSNAPQTNQEDLRPKRDGKGSQSVDSETQLDPNKSFQLKRIFYSAMADDHPEISSYRLESFDSLRINPKPCKASEAFAMYNQNDDLQLVSCTPRRVLLDEFQRKRGSPPNLSKHKIVYGKECFSLDEQWQAVPSLSAAEEMLVYSTNPLDAQVEIRYSKRDNLYYIRSTAGQQVVDFEYTLKVPTQSPALPASIQSLVDEFLTYGVGELNLEVKEATGEDYLNALLKQKKGACRHRALAFIHVMKKKFPQIDCRMVQNDCHVFAEVRVKGQWLRCDLGGYPAKLEIREQALGCYSKLSALGKIYDVVMNTWSSSDPSEHPSALGQTMFVEKGTRKEVLWKKGGSLKNFRRHLIQAQKGGKNSLVELVSKEAVNAMSLSFQAHCQRIKRPYFYIHSASDVQCMTDYLKKEGKKGSFVSGPGGPLHEFLTAKYSKDNSPVLLINYANFSPSEIVALNGLLDKERSADGIAVPEDAILIGLINLDDPECYSGADFYSRFDERHQQPISNEILKEYLRLETIREKSPLDRNCTAINLYHGCDWKAQLLGRWIFTAKGLRFEEGLLKAAIQKGKVIEIQNGPWEDPEFRFFWQQALHLGKINYNEESINTQGLQLVTSQGYPWVQLKKALLVNNTRKVSDFILNPSSLGDCFVTYSFQREDKSLVQQDGLVAKAAHEGKKSLCVDLTRTLQEDDWARLLNECKRYNITLEVNVLEGVQIPACLIEAKPLVNSDFNAKIQIIRSSDPCRTIEQLIRDPARIVIDVSELKPSDLLLETKIHYQKKKLKLEFSQQKRALLKALVQGKHLVLTGAISDELADALAPLILSKQEMAGRLTIVSNDIDNLHYASQHSEHKPKIKQKEPLAVLRARALFPRGWRGLQHLKCNVRNLGHFNPDKSQEETLAFLARRNHQIFEVLDKSPYVYIAGLSGCGKSTFIEKEFMKGVKHKLYKGEDSMEQWALDQSDCPKFLFIDEANLSSRNWSELEGLFYNKPPTILIRGELRRLSSQHKIIFAGNPANYGDERKLAPFFVRHGRTIVFDPIPLSVIYQQILLPVFIHTPLAEEAARLCAPIFEVYSFLCAQSTTEVLISPRELQMVALLTLSYCKQNPNACPIQAAKYYAYELAKPLVPEAKLAQFEQRFGQDRPVLRALPLPKDLSAQAGFTATPSRIPILNRLNELLILRELRQHSNSHSNETLRSGGLGGILLEGDSSVGKTAMVIALLRAHGYEKVQDRHAPARQAKSSYRLDVGLPVLEKEKILIKAFYEGAVVVIDEINSSPMMERLLNDLLMGKLPDKYKMPHKEVKPGFMIIGTQNPVNMAGRRPASTALLRRLCHLELPNYLAEELMTILLDKKRYPQAAKQEFELIIDSFLRKSAEAKEQGYNPGPTLRQVLQQADRVKLRYPALQELAKSSLFTHLASSLLFFAKKVFPRKSSCDVGCGAKPTVVCA